MDATVKGSFWTDSRVEELDAAAKLACLWLVTNPSRDLLGFTHVSPRRFAFETGLEMAVLQGACKGLASSFRELPGNWFFAVNFLRHQFGSKGGQLSLGNNVIKSAARQAKTLPRGLQGAFLEAYPEMAKMVLPKDENGSPSEGVIAIAIATATERKGVRGETIAAETIVSSYPRREATAECLRIVAAEIRAGADPAAMLAGTRAIAAVIATLPSGAHNAFVLSARKFFEGKRWQDDPATWARQASRAAAGLNGGKGPMSDEEVRAALGGRA